MNRCTLMLSLAASILWGQNVQRVEGFGRIVFAHNNHDSATIISARDYRGIARGYMTAGWWAPGQMKDNRLEWETAPVPERKTTIFSFVGASSPLPAEIARGPELKLFVNDRYALTFSIGLLREWSWRQGDFRLRYRPVRNEWPAWGRQRQFEIEGNSGIYELTVPSEFITAGKPVHLRVEMQPHPQWSNAWFMVKDRRDTLSTETTALREEVAQLRVDVNRLSEMVHVLATRQYSDASGQNQFEHFNIYSNGYRHVHPADTVRLRDGTILLTAREATEHVARDGDIVVVQSKDGRNWTKASRFGVPDLDEREACGIELPDGSVLLAVFYNALYRDDAEYEQKWKTKIKLGAGKQYLGFYTVVSKDKGLTWSEPRFVSTKGMPFSDTEGPADAPVAMPDGSLLLPLIGYNVNGDVHNHAAVLLRSTDNGSNWSYFSTIADDPGGKLGHFEEPGLLRLRSGVLLAAMRNNSGNIWTAKSTDGGKTWSDPKMTPMVGHPADLMQMRDGRVVCTYGMREPYHGAPGGIRASISKDDGETWNLSEDIQIRNDFLNWDVGYPESLELSDGRILSVYYYNLLGRYFIGGSFWRP